MSPALAGRLSTTAPPGKPWHIVFATIYWLKQVIKPAQTQEMEKQISPVDGRSFFSFNKFIYLFIFGCIGSLLLRAGFL